MGSDIAAIGGGLLSAGGGVVGSIMGGNAASKAANRAAAMLAQGSGIISQVEVPTIEAQLLKLQQLKLSGELTPEQVAVVDQQMTRLNQVKTDPMLRDAQMQALAKLQQIGNEGGLTATDKAQLNEVNNQVNRQEASQRNSILQNAAQRGMSGSGLEQASELMNAQNSAQMNSDEGFKVAAAAQQRALQALQAAGTAGGNIRSQDYGEQAGAAQAQDAINRFNSANRQNIGLTNTAAANQAQQYNLQRNDLQNTTNNQLANQEQIANKGLYQSQYNNQIDKAKAQANALAGQASQAQQAGQQAANMWSSLGSGVAKVGSSLLDYGLTNKPKDDKSGV